MNFRSYFWSSKLKLCWWSVLRWSEEVRFGGLNHKNVLDKPGCYLPLKNKMNWAKVCATATGWLCNLRYSKRQFLGLLLDKLRANILYLTQNTSLLWRLTLCNVILIDNFRDQLLYTAGWWGECCLKTSSCHFHWRTLIHWRGHRLLGDGFCQKVHSSFIFTNSVSNLMGIDSISLARDSGQSSCLGHLNHCGMLWEYNIPFLELKGRWDPGSLGAWKWLERWVGRLVWLICPLMVGQYILLP